MALRAQTPGQFLKDEGEESSEGRGASIDEFEVATNKDYVPADENRTGTHTLDIQGASNLAQRDVKDEGYDGDRIFPPLHPSQG